MFFKYYYSAQCLYKAWKRFRKYGAALTAATQNVEECLRSETARLMFANSEFLVLLNQAATDRAELAKLLNIDPKSWSLKWDFSNFIDQMGEFSKMLNMIADLLNAIKDGRWADAVSIGKQILNQGSENPSAMPMVTDSANSTADWIKEHWGFDPRSVGRTVRGWFGDDEPEQYAQATKRGERNNNPGNLNFAGQAGASLERPGGGLARLETGFDV